MFEFHFFTVLLSIENIIKWLVGESCLWARPVSPNHGCPSRECRRKGRKTGGPPLPATLSIRGASPPRIFPSVCPSWKGRSGSLTKSSWGMPGSRPPPRCWAELPETQICPDQNPESPQGLSDPLPPLSPAAPPQIVPWPQSSTPHNQTSLPCLCPPWSLAQNNFSSSFPHQRLRIYSPPALVSMGSTLPVPPPPPGAPLANLLHSCALMCLPPTVASSPQARAWFTHP